MTPDFAFHTWREAARRLNEVARTEGTELHPLPYRRFDPEADATWWLAPSTRNPAFADGKIVIEGPSPQSPDGPFVGLHIEKGVGRQASEVFSASARGRRLLMDEGWIWHAFARAMGTGRIDDELATAAEAAGEFPLVVALVTGVQDLPSLEQDEERTRGDTEYIWFRPSSGGLERVGEHNRGEVAARLADTETMASIGEKLAALRDLDWRWIEVMIGVPLRKVAVGGASPTEIWRRACAPWRSWLR